MALVKGSNHVDVATSINNIARVQGSGQVAEAIEMQRKAN